ncbi:hypothetical protein TRVA0_063S00584 [Trichomonascus vanleenenianus]|uniref:uncharacterized protein n=1 Tax=Trichomonascus vanleenenianus TaxID=2268995 RepID=UPI003EC9651E
MNRGWITLRNRPGSTLRSVTKIPSPNIKRTVGDQNRPLSTVPKRRRVTSSTRNTDTINYSLDMQPLAFPAWPITDNMKCSEKLFKVFPEALPDQLGRSSGIIQGKYCTLVSIEACGQAHELFDLGISVYRPQNSEVHSVFPDIRTTHYVVSDHVPDPGRRQTYVHGRSVIITKKCLAETVPHILNELSREAKESGRSLLLVGGNIRKTKNILAKHGIDISDDYPVYDIVAALSGKDSASTVEKLAREVTIPAHRVSQNAGNRSNTCLRLMLNVNDSMFWKVWPEGWDRDMDPIGDLDLPAGKFPALVRKGVSWLHSARKIYVSLDLEWWEVNNKFLTEIGLTIYNPVRPEERPIVPLAASRHFIVRENKGRRNGRYVPDNMSKYIFGKSETLPLRKCREALQELFEQVEQIAAREGKDIVLVGHAVHNDVSMWAKNDFYMFQKYEILDTMSLWTSNPSVKMLASLEKILKFLRIPCSLLHNAGNDAFMTLRLVLSLCDPTFRELHGLDEDLTLRVEEFNATHPNAKLMRKIKYDYLTNVESALDHFKRT